MQGVAIKVTAMPNGVNIGHDSQWINEGLNVYVVNGGNQPPAHTPMLG